MENCPSRLEDCRCGGQADHTQHGAGLHYCQVPGCNALWVDNGYIAQLPGKATLRRRFDRADLRAA